MNAIPVELRRSSEASLITHNKMREDVTAEFLVRVIPTKDSVSLAARTLGERTASAEGIKEVVQSRFVDAMAAVAASMTMEDIRSGRKEYMSQVAEMTAATLGSNGLEFENASLVSLNQTDISVFNPANAFDAEGLTQLTQQIEERRKLRNQIKNDTRVGRSIAARTTSCVTSRLAGRSKLSTSLRARRWRPSASRTSAR